MTEDDDVMSGEKRSRKTQEQKLAELARIVEERPELLEDRYVRARVDWLVRGTPNRERPVDVGLAFQLLEDADDDQD